MTLFQLLNGHWKVDLLSPGGGAVETALDIYLENFATTLVECLSIYGVRDVNWLLLQSSTRTAGELLEFANALLIIPKTLAVNAAKRLHGSGL